MLSIAFSGSIMFFLTFYDAGLRNLIPNKKILTILQYDTLSLHVITTLYFS